MSKISYPFLLCSCLLFGCGRAPLSFDLAVAEDNHSQVLSAHVDTLRLTADDGTVIESPDLRGVGDGSVHLADEEAEVPRDKRWQAQAFNEYGELVLSGEGTEDENNTVSIPLQAVLYDEH